MYRPYEIICTVYIRMHMFPPSKILGKYSLRFSYLRELRFQHLFITAGGFRNKTHLECDPGRFILYGTADEVITSDKKIILCSIFAL
jgi:hypothetical protein